MALSEKDIEALTGSQETFEQLVRERLRQAVRLTLMSVLEEEVTAIIGAERYERVPSRRDQRNGHYPRDLQTSIGQIEDLSVPRTRNGHQTQMFSRYQRRQREVDSAITEMLVAGASQVRVGEVMETLTGSKPSPSSVSRVFHTLQAEYEQWKSRELASRYGYAFADGTSFTVIYNGEGCKMPILAVVGIGINGEREVLGFQVGDRENQQAWEDLFSDLKQRGVKEIGLLVSDGNQATMNAIKLKFPQACRQRCVMHKMENVLSYVPSKQHDQVRPELRAIFYQKDRASAELTAAAFVEKYQTIYPTAVACLQRDLDACFMFYDFPREHWKTIRTNNVIERLFEEVKRRSHKMAAAFRNETSCVLLFYAVMRSLKFHKLTMPQASKEQPASEILHTS